MTAPGQQGPGPVTEEPGRRPSGGSRGVAPPGQQGPLVVCSPLWVEALAVRRGLRAARGAGQPDGGAVRVTGYGPARSRRQAAALAGEQFGALAVAGVGGGLTDDLVPGDMVVGTEVSDAHGTSVRCPAAPLLAG